MEGGQMKAGRSLFTKQTADQMGAKPDQALGIVRRRPVADIVAVDAFTTQNGLRLHKLPGEQMVPRLPRLLPLLTVA